MVCVLANTNLQCVWCVSAARGIVNRYMHTLRTRSTRECGELMWGGARWDSYLAHTILNVDPCCLSVHSSSDSAVPVARARASASACASSECECVSGVIPESQCFSCTISVRVRVRLPQQKQQKSYDIFAAYLSATQCKS